MEIEEAIKILGEFVNIDRRLRNENEYTNDYDEFCEERCVAIENVLNRVKELEEENKQLTDSYMIQKDLINADFLSNYVSKDKIRAIINELEKDKEGKDKSFRLYSLYDSYDIQIATLQALLDE